MNMNKKSKIPKATQMRIDRVLALLQIEDQANHHADHFDAEDVPRPRPQHINQAGRSRLARDE